MWNSPWLMLNCQRLIELWHKHLFWDGLRISTVFGVSCLQVWSWRPLRHKETTYGASRPDAKGLKIMSTKEFGIWDIGMVMRQGIPGCLTIQKYGDVIKHDIAGRAWALWISWWYHQKKLSSNDDPQCRSGTNVTCIICIAFIILQELHQKTAKISGILGWIYTWYLMYLWDFNGFYYDWMVHHVKPSPDSQLRLFTGPASPTHKTTTPGPGGVSSNRQMGFHHQHMGI